MAMKYEVNLSIEKPWAVAMDWCQDTFGSSSFKKNWSITTRDKEAVFMFTNEKDSLLFALKWL